MKTNTATTVPLVELIQTQSDALDAVLALANKPTPVQDDDLRRSLEDYGQLSPCLRQRGVIVDGRRRMAMMQALGKVPWVIDIDAVHGAQSFPDDASAFGRSFLEANGVRREMPLIVRAAIGDALATLPKGANQHTAATGMSREQAARAAGVSSDTLDRYNAVKVDPEVLARAMTGEVSLAQAARLVRSKAQAAHAKTLTSSDNDIVAGLDRLILAGAQMGLIYVDVPADYGELHSTARAAPQTKYPTMNVDALKALRVEKIAASDSMLWYWTPNSLLTEALEVIACWGFRYVTSVVWCKPTGVVSPCAVRPHHETLIVAKRGQGLVHIGEQIPSWYQSPAMARTHSSKPTWFADQLDRMFPEVAKVELFARNTRTGWTTLGNQVALVGQVAAPGTTAANDDPGASADASTGEASTRDVDAPQTGAPVVAGDEPVSTAAANAPRKANARKPRSTAKSNKKAVANG